MDNETLTFYDAAGELKDIKGTLGTYLDHCEKEPFTPSIEDCKNGYRKVFKITVTIEEVTN